jgi:nucleotide-binding universal stress UspA family protein
LRDGPEQAESTGPVDGLQAAMDAQLVVLAARQEIAKVLGTVSQYVLRNALCPVLTVSEADIDS